MYTLPAPMPRPEEYDHFDPDAHDAEQERLEALLQQLWLRDLRNLQSEADAEREAARRQESLKQSPFRRCTEAFTAAHPRPGLDDDPAAHADWEWRRLEYLYQETDNKRALTRHRLERGAFIERHTRSQIRARESVQPLLDALKSKPHPRAHDPIPWPPPDGDGVALWREKLDRMADPEELAETLRDRETPVYACADDLHAALMGWHRSLPREEQELAAPFSRAARDFVTRVHSSYRRDYAPARIGTALYGLKQAMGHAQDALDLLDALKGYWWLTPPAQRVLQRLLEDGRDAALDYYLEVRTLYDGFLARALRILGGTHADRDRVDPPAA